MMKLFIILACFLFLVFVLYAIFKIYSFHKFQYKRFEEFKNIIKKMHAVKLKYILLLDKLKKTIEEIDEEDVVSIYNFEIKKELTLLLREYVYLIHNIYLIKLFYSISNNLFFKLKIDNICAEMHEVYKLCYEDYTELKKLQDEYETAVKKYAVETKISINEKEYFLKIFKNYAGKREVIDYLEILTEMTKVMFTK